MGTSRNHAQDNTQGQGTQDMRHMGDAMGDVMVGLRSGRQPTTRKPQPRRQRRRNGPTPTPEELQAKAATLLPPTPSASGSHPEHPEHPEHLEQRSTSTAPSTPAPVCVQCGGAGWVRVADVSEDSHWQARTEPCVCQDRPRWQRALAASDISPRLRSLDFAGYDARYNRVALDAVATWARELSCKRAGNDTLYPWLFLYGGTGTGKTHLLAAAFNVVLGNGRYPLYTLYPALLDYVKDGLDSDKPGEYGARFKAVREAQILILDDLGAEKRTEWSDELLFKLLDYRYREELPTAVASNLLPIDLEPRIASRLQDRALSTALLMTGPDYRVSGPAKGRAH